MNKRLLCAAGGCLLLLCGCKPSFDCSTESSFAQSVETMTKDMTQQEQNEFAEALQYAEILIAPEQYAKTLDGMTANEFIKYIDKECKDPHFRFSNDGEFISNNFEAVLTAYLNTYGEKDGKVVAFNRQFVELCYDLSDADKVKLLKSFDGMNGKALMAAVEKAFNAKQAKK